VQANTNQLTGLCLGLLQTSAMSHGQALEWKRLMTMSLSKGATSASKATPAPVLAIYGEHAPAAADGVFIRVNGLCKRYDLSRGGVYNLIALPEFPKAIYLNAKVPLWRLREVEAFEEARRAQGGAYGKTTRKPTKAAATAALEGVGVAA
jgi:predicted DNA-binding transcriptional regulator AlpA